MHTPKKVDKSGVTDLYEEYASSVADWHGEGEDGTALRDEWVAEEALYAVQSKERACRLAASTGDVQMLEQLGAEGLVPLSKV
jgi:hypothetical protein